MNHIPPPIKNLCSNYSIEKYTRPVLDQIPAMLTKFQPPCFAYDQIPANHFIKASNLKEIVSR